MEKKMSLSTLYFCCITLRARMVSCWYRVPFSSTSSAICGSSRSSSTKSSISMCSAPIFLRRPLKYDWSS
ncbi:MAG TPA: hypothetical protein PLJ30_06855 [Deltaproteobacteria bacterium]|nr:hypothetical protein [Deltaproteobacteria bacterium]